MFKASVKVNIDLDAIMRKKFRPMQYEAQRWLHGRIIKDTDQFVPMDTGALTGSPRRSYNKGYTIVQWVMPYAKRLYYGVTFKFARDRHPKATHHWFQTSKGFFLNDWGQGVAKILCGLWRRGA